MKKIFVTRRIPERGLNKLLAFADCDVWQDELPPPRDEVLRRVRDVDGIVSLVTDRIDGEVMDAAPQLKVISNVAVGYDNIDVPAATQRNLWVTNTPGVLTETTADLGFALLLAAARHIHTGYDYARSGQWKTWGITLLLGQDVHGATLGIAGMGRIGQAIARRGKGFGMNIIYNNRKRDEAAEHELGATYVSKDELLRQSDFLMLTVPMSAETRHYIDAAALAHMKPTATLINIARGGVVDTNALYDAMKARKIFAAALDVTDPEPLPHTHPLYALDNVLIIPHLGSASVETRSRMADIAASNMISVLSGNGPLNAVNKINA